MQKLTILVKPLKVVLINTLYAPHFVGGAEKSVQLLAEGLHQLGHNAVVISLSAANKNKIQIVNGIKVYYLANRNIYWPFQNKSVSKFKKSFWHVIDTYFSLYNRNIDAILKEELPDIIHTNNLSGFSTSLLSYLKSKKYPIIHTARDYYLMCFKNTLYKNGKVCDKLCRDCSILSHWKFKQINKNVDRFIGISKYVVSRHLNSGLSKNIPTEYIYNAVIDVKEKSNKTKKQNVFGYIGALNEAKGLELLLGIFCSDNLKNQDWKLKIAGRGSSDYVDYLKSFYTNEKIEFVGFVDAMEFYKGLDALIVPSQWEEPFGRVVIEAAQMGLTVFVSEKGGLVELIPLLNSVKKLNMNSILEFIAEDKHKIEIYNSLNQFDNKTITDKYINAYKKVLSLN
ncbi:glycosyltransferase family 4 protein [Mangrovimonas sp. ST2L15]|uniref:glycosyltransferase family 4 protein n=1 Tax=Mangrovimonas sp. ST2L15 TaxID=1645916 RepID=UPI0006B5702C|nr:glycosyltransferase family 4 protein [Mangrovimonas sp. ST2L15]